MSEMVDFVARVADIPKERALLAITAMREPSKEMVRAAVDYMDKGSYWVVEGLWCVMVDAALAEEARSHQIGGA